jgi:hypothetical protein
MTGRKPSAVGIVVVSLDTIVVDTEVEIEVVREVRVMQATVRVLVADTVVVAVLVEIKVVVGTLLTDDQPY